MATSNRPDENRLKSITLEEYEERKPATPLRPLRTPESMKMFEEAVAEEESGKDYTPTETSFLEDQEGGNFKERPESIVSGMLRPHLEVAEGNKTKVYQGKKDKEGVLTVGIGHKLTPAELKQYEEGDEVTPEQVEKWYKEDSKKAVTAAIKQAKEVGVESHEFMSALASVNFQLGTSWNKDHEKTWKLMKESKFKEAADEAEDSDWYRDQTPGRVRDFQMALRKIAKEKEFSGFEDGVYEDPDTKERFKVRGGKRL